jgi:RNA polymerase-binding transcription factor DksA
MADIGSDNFEQEFTLGLLENAEKVMAEIDGALVRIKAGTFGQCEDCNAEITKERLKALPYARHCITCARKLES